jgi:hypothetical protein
VFIACDHENGPQVIVGCLCRAGRHGYRIFARWWRDGREALAQERRSE